MKNSMFLFLAMIISAFSFAQSSTNTTELLSNEKFTPDSVKVLHIEPMDNSLEVILEVVTTGAIQKRMGSMLSGGKEPVELRGTYAYTINDKNEITNVESYWLKEVGAPDKFNYLTMPLINAESHNRSKVFATEENAGHLADYWMFRTMKIEDLTEQEAKQRLKKEVEQSFESLDSSLRNTFTPLKKLFTKKEFTGDDLPEKVYTGDPVISLFSGKLKKLRSGIYTKRPDGEKKFLSGRYERAEYEKYDIEMEDIFDNDDKRFTLSHHSVTDPLTGNVIIIGDVKVRKDDDRENNQYFEHLILTLDRKGKVLNKQTIKNEKAWNIGGVKLIGENKFAIIPDPTFDKIYLDQDQPDKDWNKGADLSIDRMLLINKEGNVEYTAEFQGTSGNNYRNQRVTQLGDVLLTNYYQHSTENPLAGIYTFNKTEGLVDQKLLQDGHPDYLEAGLIPTGKHKELMNIYYYTDNDSTKYLIDLLYHPSVKGTEETPGSPAMYYNYLMYRINPDGSLSDPVILKRQFDSYTELMEVEILAVDENNYVLKIIEPRQGNNFVRIKTVSKKDMSTQSFSAPHPLVYGHAFYQDPDTDTMYFVVKNEKSQNIELITSQ